MFFRTKGVLVLVLGLVSTLFFACTDNNPSGPGSPTDPGPTVTDADGNVYTSVVIGNQVWTVENLRSTKYADGSPIPHVTDNAEWGNLTTPAYCWYDNSTNSLERSKWGALYNWFVVSPNNPKQIAPSGWRVPTDRDWSVLASYLIANGYNWDGTTSGNKIAKAMAAQTDWASSGVEGTPGYDLSSNNRTGFSALPGGCRLYDGYFFGQSYDGGWWSATEGNASYAYYRLLYYYLVTLYRYSCSKSCGFSLRLVRDR